MAHLAQNDSDFRARWGKYKLQAPCRFSIWGKCDIFSLSLSLFGPPLLLRFDLCCVSISFHNVSCCRWSVNVCFGARQWSILFHCHFDGWERNISSGVHPCPPPPPPPSLSPCLTYPLTCVHVCTFSLLHMHFLLLLLQKWQQLNGGQRSKGWLIIWLSHLVPAVFRHRGGWG